MKRAAQIFGVILAAAPAMAAERFATAPTAPFELRAEHVEISEPQNRMTLKNAARVQQGPLTLTADNIALGFTAARQLANIRAKGNVIVTSRAARGTGQSAHYDPQTQILTVSGGVKLMGGEGGTLAGDAFHLDTKSGRASIVGGTGGRVRGLIVPK